MRSRTIDLPVDPLLLSSQQNKTGQETMTKKSIVRSVETLSCDAGWRNYHFVKIVTEDGITGWSEFDEGFGAPGVTAAIERLRRGWSARTPSSTNASMQSCFRRRVPLPAAWWRWRSARSRMRCSTSRPRRWVCPATNCSAEKSVTASGSTGRIARPGASITPTGTSRRSPASTASRRSGARCAKKALPR